MNAFRREQIFDAERDALERASFVRCNSRVRSLCHRSRLVMRYRDIGVEGPVVGVDRGKVRFGQFNRGNFLRPQLLAGLGDGKFRQIGHGMSVQAASNAAKGSNLETVETVAASFDIAYSTTLGTRKKFSSVAGALAITSAALSPSVTAS